MNNDFIKRIQNSEERTKRFWIGVFSAVTMTGVLMLWAAYGALTAAPREVAVVPAAEPEIAVVVESKSEAKSRLALLGEAVSQGFSGLKELLSRDYSFKISDADRNFIYDELSPVPPTNLP